jgi:hypothetical protein
MKKLLKGGRAQRTKLIAASSALLCGVALLRPLAGNADAPVGRFQSLPTLGAVYDTVTKLTWQYTPRGASNTWTEARDYCQALLLAGGNWRLPTCSELETLVDAVKETAFDTQAFPSSPTCAFWASTRDPFRADYAWHTSSGGHSTSAPESDTYREHCVRCVR